MKTLVIVLLALLLASCETKENRDLKYKLSTEIGLTYAALEYNDGSMPVDSLLNRLHELNMELNKH